MTKRPITNVKHNKTPAVTDTNRYRKNFSWFSARSQPSNEWQQQRERNHYVVQEKEKKIEREKYWFCISVAVEIGLSIFILQNIRWLATEKWSRTMEFSTCMLSHSHTLPFTPMWHIIYAQCTTRQVKPNYFAFVIVFCAGSSFIVICKKPRLTQTHTQHLIHRKSRPIVLRALMMLFVCYTSRLKMAK